MTIVTINIIIQWYQILKIIDHAFLLLVNLLFSSTNKLQECILVNRL